MDDVRDAQAVDHAAAGQELIFHLAGQTAVTTAVAGPQLDFEANALGTLNVLESARKSEEFPTLLFASTNKVYGGMTGVPIVQRDTRYDYADLPFGASEAQPLDFHSPYECSKGAADQYVRDYSRIYGLRTIVFRQSCIYAPQQIGIEDQGWVAWFVIAAHLGRPFTIYGDGRQVRDLLYVDDLIRAYDLAVRQIRVTAGQVYNIGGGPANTLSVWAEFGPLLSDLFEREIRPTAFADWRPGDQPVFISDVRKAERDFNWRPKIGVREGIRRLTQWVQANSTLFGA
jgi:CDP-paratose 2-epimerase